VLLTKLGRLLGQDYDWSEEVEAIRAPTMIVVGDADSVRTAHAVRFFELLGGGKADAGWDGSGTSNARLAILPATTHYEIFSSPTLASTVTPFLDAPVPEDNHLVTDDPADAGGGTRSSSEPASDLPSELAKPARRALTGAGYVRVEQFTKLTEAEVLRLHGMGPKTLDQIRHALAARGQSFADGS
jgi:hypothetical protein